MSRVNPVDFTLRWGTCGCNEPELGAGPLGGTPVFTWLVLRWGGGGGGGVHLVQKSKSEGRGFFLDSKE